MSLDGSGKRMTQLYRSQGEGASFGGTNGSEPFAQPEHSHSEFETLRRELAAATGAISNLQAQVDQLRRELSAVRSPASPAATVTVVDQTKPLSFVCNICGTNSVSRISDLAREAPSCKSCRSSVRQRALVHALSLELFGESLLLSEFPERKDIKGLGLSDWEGYARTLARKLGYTNTFYTKEPKLDISAPVRPDYAGRFDFILSGDVFEHVVPPVSEAFENCRRMLKPNGLLVLTVPYTKHSKTVEHFPELHDFRIVENGGSSTLENTTKNGVRQVFKNLVFHGVGRSLEMRVFSESALLDLAARAGFKVKIHRDPAPQYGVVWLEDRSMPLALRPL